jgi:uncharacterized RDD family membrane protein YckC
MPDPPSRSPGSFDSQSETMALASSTWRDAPPPRSGPAPGATLGRYHLRRVLGKGGMGQVFEAEDLDSGRHLALKVLARGPGDARDLARFLREGRLAASINHPNTVYVFGTEEVDGLPIITMELASGGTLRDRVAAAGPMTPRDAVDATLQICAGLQAAAAGGVLHRDIKPSNCFIDAGGTVKVGDFGLSVSMVAGDETRADRDLTRAGTVIGTPAFASPEQLRGQPLDVRADIYSVSATLYYLVTGRAPFEDDNLMQLLTSVAQAPPPPPRSIRAAIPAGLEDVILRGLAKKPQDRFGDYREFAAALEPFRGGAVAPAALGRRVLANIVDRVALYAVSSAAGLLAFVWLGFDRAIDLTFGWWTIATAMMSFAYFTVFEGWWGASPGKALCGLRVVDAGGHQPPRGRVALRSLIFALATNVTPALRFTVMDTELAAEATLDPVNAAIETLVTPVLFAILFCTARRRNGFAGLHELATGTRVVAAAAAREWRLPAGRTVSPRIETPHIARVGPYQIIGSLAPGLRLGFDDRLQRQVWIRDHAAVDAGRRDLSRPARLRWIAGRSLPDETWDAFEAPDGQPLTDVVGGGQRWAIVREWLHDLAAELAAGLRDGSLPDLALDRVWISPDGRARLLDWPAPGVRQGEVTRIIATAPANAGSAQPFLAAVSDFALQASPLGRRGASVALPLGAQATLDRFRLASFASAEALALAADRLVEGPAEVTWRRRALQLAIVAAPVIAAAALMLLLSRTMMSLTEDSPWIQLLGTAELLDTLEERQAGPAATAAGAEELRAMRIHVSDRLSALQANADVPAFARQLLQSDDAESVRRAQQIVPKPSAEDLAFAGPIAERLMKAHETGRDTGPQSLLRTTVIFALVFLAAIGVTSIALALIMREGPLFRTLDVAVVTPLGRRASRARAAARALAAWTPILAIALALAGRDVLGTRIAWTIVAAAGTVFLAGVVFAIYEPQRGLQDRIAGTALVPK